MHEKSDAQLLRDYAEHGQEAAFRELVSRYTDLVYSAALRQVESSHIAADIAQCIFVDLAHKAQAVGEKLPAHRSLAGWLHRSTRFTALNHLRDTRRRLTNERQAMEQLLTDSAASGNWEQIRPALDEALDSLGDEDREALLLRYFKNHNLRTVGLALGISDDTAQKRVSRAVERLREFFIKRGVTVGTSGLVVALSAHAIQAAPVSLAVTISAASVLAGTTLASTATVTATKAIVMTALQKIIIGATLTAAVGTGIYQARQNSALRSEVESLKQQRSVQLEQQNQERDEVSARMTVLQDENERAKLSSAELLKLRGELARLRAREVAAAKPADSAPAQPVSQTNSPAITELPKESWADVGFANPQSTLQTRGWAVLTGNRERFKESVFITDGARRKMEQMLEQMIAAAPEAERKRFSQQILDNQLGLEEGLLMPMMAENNAKGYTGYQILSQQFPSDNEAILEVATGMTSAPAKKETMKLQRFGSNWRVVIDEDFISTRR